MPDMSANRLPVVATIVIPTHDRPELLERAVASALAQTAPEIQVVVVDDGSTRPVQLPHDPRLDVVRNPHPLGPSAARNLGLKVAAGPWITFPDDDDELLPDMVQVSLEAAEGSRLPGPVAVLSRVEVVDAHGQVVETRQATTVARQPPPYHQAPDDGFAQDANTLFAPTEVLRALGGWDETIKGWEMDDLLIRLVRPGPRRGPAGAAQAPPLLPGPPPAARPAAGHPRHQLHPQRPLVAGRAGHDDLAAGRPGPAQGAHPVGRRPHRAPAVRLVPGGAAAPQRPAGGLAPVPG